MLEKHPIVNRVYLTLDKPFNMSIMDYKWSSTKLPWVLEKVIWNSYSSTSLRNSLRDGKYLLGVF